MPYKILPTFTEDNNEVVSDSNIESWFEDIKSENHSEMVMVGSTTQLNRLRLGLLEKEVSFTHFNFLGEMLEVNEFANFNPSLPDFCDTNLNIVSKILMAQIALKKSNKEEEKPET